MINIQQLRVRFPEFPSSPETIGPRLTNLRTRSQRKHDLNNKKINNRYHSLDIPLLVGYDVPLGRMHASLSAGVVINISAWQRGQFLDPSLEPANIDVDETDEYYPAYKTTLGVGAYLSASLAVPISKDIWFFGEPYILHRFDPVTFDEYSIKQGNTNFGINVGLKLKL